jgi:hypothetical protein
MAGFEYDLKNFSIDRGFFVFLILFGAICPPFWFIFQFNYPLFKETDLLKFLLICLSIGGPLQIIHWVFVVMATNGSAGKIDKKEEEENTYVEMAIASIITTFLLYTPCILTFFSRMNERDAIIISAFIEVAIIFCSFFIALNKNPKKTKTH